MASKPNTRSTKSTTFYGGWRSFMGNRDDDWGGGWVSVPLICILLLITVVALLFTARYPKGLYELRDRHQPVGYPGARLRVTNAQRVSTVPPRHGAT